MGEPRGPLETPEQFESRSTKRRIQGQTAGGYLTGNGGGRQLFGALGRTRRFVATTMAWTLRVSWRRPLTLKHNRGEFSVKLIDNRIGRGDSSG